MGAENKPSIEGRLFKVGLGVIALYGLALLALPPLEAAGEKLAAAMAA